MAAQPFHLAWFLQGSSIQAWGEPWTGNISEEWMSPDLITKYGTLGMSVDLIGCPDPAVARMDEVMQEAGGDGFLLALGNVNRRNVAEITEGLVPVLQQRGLVRRAYSAMRLQDNLPEF